MANVVVTIKIMPESPESDLENIQSEAKNQIKDFCGSDEIKAEKEPVAFGLVALKLTFVMDEDKGSTDALENNLKNISQVNSAEVVDVRRAVG